MEEHKEIAEYTEFMGVDIKADDIVRDPVFASDGGQNILFGSRGEIRRLPGAVAQFDSKLTASVTREPAGVNLMEFIGFSQTNVLTRKLMAIGYDQSISASALKELVDEDLLITYIGAGIAEIEIGDADGTNSITLYVNSVSVYSQAVETTIVSAIATAIDAITDWNASAAGSNSTYATLRSFYRIKRQTLATAGINARYSTCTSSNAVISISSIPSSAAPTSTHINPPWVCLNNILYFANTLGLIYKFDGHWVYQAGLKKPTITSASYISGIGSTPGMTAGDLVTFAARARHVDYGGNTIYSPFAFSTIALAGGDNMVQCTVSHAASMQSQINRLTPSSNQVGVTTVATNATSGVVKVGDILTWGTTLGGVGPLYTRTITAVAANSVTFVGAATALTTDRMTHNVCIEIYASTVLTSGTQNEAGPFYMVAEAFLAFSASTYAYDRFASDATITTTYPIFTQVRRWEQAPPAAKYLAKFQTSLVIGDFTEPGLVHFSDQEGQEQFDLAVNNFTVEGAVTGLGGNKEFLAIFKEDNTDVLVGDLQGFSVRVDRVDDDIGCVSHASIQRMDESRLFFLSKKGPYQISSGSVSPIGPHTTKSGRRVSRLEPFYTKNRGEDYTVAGVDQPFLAMSRSVGCLWPSRNMYIIHTPFESRQYPGFQYSGFSDLVRELSTWAYNWEKDIWCPVWEMAPNCGGFEIEGEFKYLTRTYYTGSDANKYYGVTSVVSNTGTTKDFLTATGFKTSKYVSGWFHLGKPSMNKRFLRVRLFCHGTAGNTTFTMDLKSEINFQAGTYPTNIAGITFTVGGEKKVKLSSQKARAIRVSFEAGTVNEDITVNGIVIEWCPSYHCGFKE